ncbi:VanZ family protein [Sporosarcina psychrophila]|uniref:VanZ family protein n=1 Tax=Sporosarcina psychrophila TaxID=1476 RepID=UPI00078EC4C6|nr:VanZ family protein [Sporosarcina psychrophila]AMQ07898.1 antibiotic resistance protein VanZ [Sporosarcina psychrophila]
MKKIIVVIILLSTLVISSGQTYEQQSLIPTLERLLPGKPLESTLSKLHVPYWGKTISLEERGYYHFIEFLLRKSAHFIIFGFLAVAIYLILPKHKFRMLTATFLTLLLAIGDEYHQSLTGGRTPTAQDVILDMAGAVTFLILLRLLLLMKEHLFSPDK